VDDTFVLPRFGSCKPTPRWGGHKDRISFNHFPLSNGHLDRVSFSSQSIGTLCPHKDHHTIGVSCLDYNWVGNKKEGIRKAIQAQELKWTQLSLSLVTIWLEWSLDLGENLVSCLCLWMKSRALVWGLKAENLDALKCGGWGIFIAPTTKLTVGEGFCRMAHRTLSGAPATSPGRWVSTVGASDNWTTGQSGGAPNSHYSLSGVPSGTALTSARAGAHCSLLLFRCGRPLALCSHYSAGTPNSLVLHRTVRWIIAELLPEFSKVASSEWVLVHRTLSGGTPDSPVRQPRAAFGLSFALFIWTLSWTLIGLCWTFGTCRTHNLEQTS
jgi:hypothetical protein